MKRIWLPALSWALLWLAGSLLAALQLQSQLEQAASSRLKTGEELMEGIKARVQGQAVILAGEAARQHDVQEAMRLMREEVRLPGWGMGAETLNPVREVRDEILLKPRPPGWGVLAATARAVHLRGVAGSENEANRMELAVRSAGQLEEALTNELVVDGESCVESDRLDESIRTVPALTKQEIVKGMLAAVRWGEPWTLLDVKKPAEVLRKEIIAHGLPAEAWDTEVFAEVERVRDARESFESAAREKERLAALAPGHVIMALRGDQILLRGELGSGQACQLLADAVRIAGGSRVVIDELAASSHRRPGEDSRLLASTLPSLPTGLLAKFVAIGTPDTGWKVLNLNAADVENPSSITQGMLPQGLDLRLALPDISTALAWIHSIDSAPSQEAGARQVPYFMIMAAGDHVYLRGAVAEEAVRSQVENAARRLYGTRSLDCEVRLDGNCLPVAPALQTMATLPPPPARDTAGILAFAFGGDVWHARPLADRLFDPLGLGQSGLLPDGVPANPLMPELVKLAPMAKAHLAALNQAGRGIPAQSPQRP